MKKGKENTSEKDTSKKKVIFKKTGIIIRNIALVVLGLILVIGVPLACFFSQEIREILILADTMSIEESYDFVDISITDEQKLEDLEYLYKYAFVETHNYEAKQELYGINYDELYEEYKELIVNTKNEFEYFTLLECFINNYGSGHAQLKLPHYVENSSTGFQLNPLAINYPNAKEHIYTWEKTLGQQAPDYAGNTGCVSYVDGSYILYSSTDETIWPKEYLGAEITSINGGDPIEFIVDNIFYVYINYDEANDKAYRRKVFFNDSQGTPVEFELLLEDGTTATFNAYTSPYVEMNKIVTGKYSKVTSNTEKEKEERNYEIFEDNERDLVYFALTSCVETGEEEQMMAELEDVVSRHDNIIVDIRDNTGGWVDYFDKFVYHIIFNESLNINYDFAISKNDLSDLWYKNNAKKIEFKIKYDKATNEYHFKDQFEFTGGENVADKNVMVLTGEMTYSSGDITAHALSKLDNTTLVGTSTGGEGVEGPIFVYNLPNSRLHFSYSPCYNIKLDGYDAIIGTDPDVYVHKSLEDERHLMKYALETGTTSDTYAEKLEYDDTLLKAIELLENK